IYIASTSGPDRQTYGAMYDFGDSILFLAVLAVAAVPATGAALFFLRPHRSFWLAICVAAPAVAVPALVAMIQYVAGQGAAGAAAHTAGLLSPCSGFSPLRCSRELSSSRGS